MQEVEQQIQEIMNSIECSKNFKCYRAGFTAACRVKDIGVESLLECLEPNPQTCQYALSFGYSYFCQCPLQLFLFSRQNNNTEQTTEQ